MQNSGAFRPNAIPHSSFRLAYTASPAPTTPLRGGTPLGARDRLREQTLELDTDENAPPDPSREPGDDLPPAGSRMIGAFDAASTAANTPRTLVARLSPARTLSGSVVATPTAGMTPMARKNRIAFRADPTMVTTFDKKVDGELYDLWTSK